MANTEGSIPIDKSKMTWIERPIMQTISEEKAAALYQETPELDIPGFKVSASGGEVSSKRWKRMKENPLVPLGILCTAGAIGLGLVSMYRGQRRRSQLMMRFRVGFQGFTLVCIIASLYKAGVLSTEKILANSSLDEPAEAQKLHLEFKTRPIRRFIPLRLTKELVLSIFARILNEKVRKMSKKTATTNEQRISASKDASTSSASDQDGDKKVSKDKDDQATKFLGVIRTEVVCSAPKKGAQQQPSKNLITKRLTTAERLKITGGSNAADSKKKHKKKHRKKKKKHKKKEASGGAGGSTAATSSAASSSTTATSGVSKTSSSASAAPATSSTFGSLKTGTAASLVAPYNKSVTQSSAMKKISIIKESSTKDDDEDEEEEQENGSKNVKNAGSVSKSINKPQKKA